MGRSAWCVVALSSAMVGIGCGSDDRRGGGGGDDAGASVDGGSGSDGGGGVDGGGGGVDAGGGGVDAGAPPAGSLVFDASDIFEGSLWLAGTVTLPESSSGQGIQINVVGDPDEGFPGNQVGLLGNTSGDTVDYAVTGLAPGIYRIQLRVDATGNGMLGDAGDWEGWYDGTVEAPVLDQSGAAPVDVHGTVTGVDFGLAILP